MIFSLLSFLTVHSNVIALSISTPTLSTATWFSPIYYGKGGNDIQEIVFFFFIS